MIRKFSQSLKRLSYEELENISNYMESHTSPSANVVKKAEYLLPTALFSSYRQQKRDPSVKFRDIAIVKVRSGDGGSGKVSFLREAGRAMGPPDGGDGGAGGSIYIQAVEGLNSLHHIRHLYKAQNGRGGGSTQLNGKNGENVILQVPIGTRVRWSPDMDELKKMYAIDADNEFMKTEITMIQNLSRFDGDAPLQLERPSHKDGDGWLFKEKEEEYFRQQPWFKKLAAKVRYFDLITRRREAENDTFPINGLDLSTAGEPIKLIQGGMGGLGNMHFLTGDIRNPRFAKIGRYGCEASFILELKLIADLGLVGLPNAGKSSLLRAISRATPRVGHWEFTTLSPSIGTISTGMSTPPFTVADIPGIIKGSSENKGLGLGFLRHIERTGGLVFVVGLDRPNPVEDLQVLCEELGKERMKGKNLLVVATKADIEETQERFEKLRGHVQTLGSEWSIIPCSAVENGNIEAVISEMAKAAQQTRA